MDNNSLARAAASNTSEPTSTLQNVALGILFGFPAVALITVIVRTAGRWRSRQFSWDDGLICVAMLFSIGETFASFKFIKTNFIGIPRAEIPQNRNVLEGMIWNYIVQILYNPILALVKSSALIFLYRLFGQKKGVRQCIIILNVVTLLHMVATFFAILFQCTPFEFIWNRSIPGGRCIDQRILFVATASFTILTDLLVLALPAYIFRDLQIPQKTKVALLVVFLLGGIVTIAGIVRLVILVRFLFNLRSRSSDGSANIGFITSAIETNLALITASVPALMPLLRSWFPSLFRGDPTSTGVRKVPLRDMKSRIQLRGNSPPESEEQAMTFNGIVRANQVHFVPTTRFNADERLTNDNRFTGDTRYVPPEARFMPDNRF